MRTQKEIQTAIRELNNLGVSYKNIAQMSNMNQTTLLKLVNTPVYQYNPHGKVLVALDEGLNKYRDLFDEILATPSK